MYKKLINDALEGILKENSLLFEAARYSVLGDGKRLRPLLVITAAHCLGASTQKALFPACAIELIHCYSLIHDDLPCMDDDDFRRGKPTLHRVYPEGQAVLTGDLLLTLGFEVISKAPHLRADQIVSLVQVLSTKAGKPLVGGQSLDLIYKHSTLSWNELREIHLGKTASLLSACLEFGAIIADREDLRSTLVKIGEEIGLSFQLIDDLLDHEGIPRARALAEELLESAMEKCVELRLDKTPLADLLLKLVYRTV